MGADDASNPNPKPGHGGDAATNIQTPVILNVYDLTPANHYAVWFGFGIFHSGIEVHGMEYGFGAHDFPISGVFEVEPRTCPGFIFRTSIPLGHINMSASDFRDFIERVASEYHGDTYHLIYKNCNHFTDDMAMRLTAKGIPGWVNRLAKLGSVCSCLLPESLQVTTVKQLHEYHACTEEEDGSDTLSVASNSTESEEEENHDKQQLISSAIMAGSDVNFIKEAES
ncbi:deSI-like protein At4g17486 [Impatiens glandulifera]|uniref:deSI-like protein At4g17486 n=1 Tax=Impatiens glandulifera TaxID=253017 RepID=UPI001FB123EB|nr:deSI-like protein At4g17486 [Impatiens glandulifera]